MKNLVISLLVGLFVSNAAFAVVDTDTNSMGIYFDHNADIWECSQPPFVIVPAYIILTNPDFDGVFGYEFGYTAFGNFMMMGTTMMGTWPIDVGGGPGNHVVVLAAPMATTAATTLCALSVFIMDANPIYFTLSGAIPNSIPGSNLPVVLDSGDVVIPTGLSAGLDPEGNPVVCAIINGSGVVATTQASWSHVKSLYR